jgi:hypothetical protein
MADVPKLLFDNDSSGNRSAYACSELQLYTRLISDLQYIFSLNDITENITCNVCSFLIIEFFCVFMRRDTWNGKEISIPENNYFLGTFTGLRRAISFACLSAPPHENVRLPLDES